jgi:hypothetical protein
MIRTYEYKLRPNKKFIAACERTLDQARFVYNCALEHRITHYRTTGQSLSLFEQSRQLTGRIARRESLPARDSNRRAG